MKRYTKKNDFNEHGGYMVEVEDVNIMWDGNHMVHGGSHIDRLAEYENTGLIPEQIDLIGKFLKQIMDKAECETYDELIELIKDGRFFVISKGMKEYMEEMEPWRFYDGT